jgi:hypothetical protein
MPTRRAPPAVKGAAPAPASWLVRVALIAALLEVMDDG